MVIPRTPLASILFCTNSLALYLQLVVISASYPIYLLFSVFVLANLLAGKCNLAFNGRGARVFWSNPLTQTNPAKQFLKISKQNIAEYCYLINLQELMLILEWDEKGWEGWGILCWPLCNHTNFCSGRQIIQIFDFLDFGKLCLGHQQHSMVKNEKCDSENFMCFMMIQNPTRQSILYPLIQKNLIIHFSIARVGSVRFKSLNISSFFFSFLFFHYMFVCGRI